MAIVSRATYRSARQSLLSAARSYRQWAAREPSNRVKFLEYLKVKQRQMAALRSAIRVPVPAAEPW